MVRLLPMTPYRVKKLRQHYVSPGSTGTATGLSIELGESQAGNQVPSIGIAAMMALTAIGVMAFFNLKKVGHQMATWTRYWIYGPTSK